MNSAYVPCQDADMYTDDGGRTWHGHCLECGWDGGAVLTFRIAERMAEAHSELARRLADNEGAERD